MLCDRPKVGTPVSSSESWHSRLRIQKLALSSTRPKVDTPVSSSKTNDYNLKKNLMINHLFTVIPPKAWEIFTSPTHIAFLTSDFFLHNPILERSKNAENQKFDTSHFIMFGKNSNGKRILKFASKYISVMALNRDVTRFFVSGDFQLKTFLNLPQNQTVSY